jgi:polysaccharide pyruvyl transferase WcaK-like protein
VLSTQQVEDDRLANAELRQRYPQLKLAPEFRDPCEAKSFIAELDFFSGARMHACIAALSAGVPVVPLAYSRKFKGLLDGLEYPWLADGRELSTDEAFAYIVRAFEQRSSFVDALDRVQSNVDKLLGRYERYIGQLLGSSGPRAAPVSGIVQVASNLNAEPLAAAAPKPRAAAG